MTITIPAWVIWWVLVPLGGLAIVGILFLAWIGLGVIWSLR